MDNLMMSLQNVFTSQILSSSSSETPTLLVLANTSSYPFQEGNGSDSLSMDTSFSPSPSSPSTEVLFDHDVYGNWTDDMKQELLNQLRRTMFALTSRAKAEIYIYSFLFIISVIGNVSAVTNLLKRENRRKRMNRLVIHLSLADLMVTFITIPFEVGWRFTVTWKAGVIGCKVFQFLRVFGLYLSSMVLVCISVDRYYAIVHPLKVNYVNQRNRRLLTMAWVVSIFFSIPEAIVYSVKPHPLIPDFVQCVSFNFFPYQWMEKGYNFFCLFGLYFGPLLVIIVCYSQILRAIFTQPVINDVLQTRESEAGPKGRTRRWLLRIRERRKQRRKEKKERSKIQEKDTELDVLKSTIHEKDGKEWERRGNCDIVTEQNEERGKDEDKKEEKMLLHEQVTGTCQVVIEPREPEKALFNPLHQPTQPHSFPTPPNSSSPPTSNEPIIVSTNTRLKLSVKHNALGTMKDGSKKGKNTIINEDSSNFITNHSVSYSPSHQVTPSITHNTIRNVSGMKSTVSSYVSLSNKIRRAKRRTVRMSIVIIAAFLICWTPYVVVVFWYQIDEESAKRFDEYTKDGLFTFAVANSCLNPLVYASHLIKSACHRSTNRLTNAPIASRVTKRSIVDSTGNTV